ncbi:MAG: siderophore-interacting protein [Nocardioides sp.]
MTTTAHRLPMILTEVTVTSVERISPSFVRVELASPDLADFGVDGPLLDQRIKLVFPTASGRLASLAGADESFWSTWLEIPEEERGHMRTYSVRDVRGSGADTRVVVDLVLHLADGATGPGSLWAAAAAPGDRLLLIGPRRGEEFGGIEFVPGTARSLLLAADETAVPAACRILCDLPRTAVGAAFLEVPTDGDTFAVQGPPGVQVVWLPRGEAVHGEPLVEAVRRHVGLAPTVALVEEDVVDPDLWETPTFSSSGEELDGPVTVGHDVAGVYAWIAGESRVVTTLRRCLVNEVEMDRRQVAFMGYWRHGVAMRS